MSVIVALLSYIGAEVFFALAIFIAFRRSDAFRSRVRFVLSRISGLDEVRGAASAAHYRIDREISNRRILRDRVEKIRDVRSPLSLVKG